MIFVNIYKINQNLEVGGTHPSPSARVYLVVYLSCFDSVFLYSWLLSSV